MKIACVVLFVLCLPGAVQISVEAAEMRVAAASSLHHLLTETAKAFEIETGHRIILIFGSSGNLVSQIRQGAPYDMFFSADQEYAERLESAGLTIPGSSLNYARGQLVLWTLQSSGFDPRAGLTGLARSSTGKIAIAHPDHAPYGQAAVHAMKHYGVYDTLKSRLVFGENVQQASQFAESGSVVAGIIALSLAITPRMARIGWHRPLPPESYPALNHTAVVLRGAQQKETARQFLAYFERPEIRKRLPEFGFLPPSQD